MQVSKVSNSNNSFGRLYLANSLRKKVTSGVSEKLNQEVAAISRIIRKNDLHKRRYVDIILAHDDLGFKSFISSKKEGVPMNPNAIKRIGDLANEIDSFRDWVDDWNYAYSPTGLAEIKKLQNYLKNTMIKIYSKS